MDIWKIALIFLWINPIISFALYKLINKKPLIIKRIFKFSLFLCIIITGCLLLKLSTSSVKCDFIVLGLLHLSICFIAWYKVFQTKKSEKVKKILSLIFLITVLYLGYFLSTVGILGLALVLGEYEPTKTIRINENIVYREYDVGNATVSWGGTRVCLYRNNTLFPFIERKFFEKMYISDEKEITENLIKPGNSYVNNTPIPFSSIIELKYDPIKEEVILFGNKNKTDTLHLTKK